MSYPRDDYQIQWLAAARAAPRSYSVVGSMFASCVRSLLVSWICLGVVLIALALPAGGFGFPTCQFHELTRLPCFGCGLTRSFVGMAHLDLIRATLYHPGGVPLFGLALYFAALLPVSAARRDRIAARAEEWGRPATYLAVGFLVLFVLYGIARMAWVTALLSAGKPSPW